MIENESGSAIPSPTQVQLPERESETDMLTAIVRHKLVDVRLPGQVIAFTALEAELAGAFDERAIGEAEARAASDPQ